MAESVVGGYDYVFITDLSEDFVCTLCHLAFKKTLYRSKNVDIHSANYVLIKW